MMKKRPVSFSGMLGALTFLVGFAPVLGFLGRYSWFLDLFSHFRVQYFLWLGTAAVFCAWRGKRTAALYCAVFAAVNLPVLLPFYFPASRDVPADAGPRIRLMSANVNARWGDPARVSRAIQDNDPDVLVLSEIDSRWAKELAPVLKRFAFAETQIREDSFGIALYSKLPFVSADVLYLGTDFMPSVQAVVETEKGSLTVIGTHTLSPRNEAEASSQKDQLEKIAEHIASVPGPLILAGDINATPWGVRFRDLQRATGLRDSARGMGIQPTWPSFMPVFFIPIDHALHSEGVVILDRHVGPFVRSDHYPIIVDFALAEDRRHAVTSVPSFTTSSESPSLPFHR